MSGDSTWLDESSSEEEEEFHISDFDGSSDEDNLVDAEMLNNRMHRMKKRLQ